METATLFGGRVRAATLEALASTPKPLSAYRVAKICGAQPIQVGAVLKGLEPTVVRRTPEGWILANENLRRFLREMASTHESAIREEKDELLNRLRLKSRSKRRSR